MPLPGPPVGALGLLLLAACGAPGSSAGSPAGAPAVAPAGPGATGALPNFLVIVPDTLRADRVGRRAPDGPVTPNLDALAARGALFTQMYSQSGWTMPALASLLTGRYPLAPSATEDTTLDFMRSDLLTMPELFRAAGYRTAVFWSPFMAEAPAEFSRGFQDKATQSGDDFATDVVAWLSAADHRPFFVLVHNSDLQFPVVPVPGDPLLATVAPAASTGLEPTFQIWLSKGGFDQARRAAPVAYDATVRRYDAAIGRILAGLTAAGQDADTVVVVTSNHGIELGEHGHYKHGNLYDYDLHVPLVIADPHMPRRGMRIATRVQTMDLAPTLLERAGRRADADVTGHSFLSLLGEGSEPYVERDVYSLCSTTTMSARSGRYKVLRSAPKGEGEASVTTAVYDLQQNPQELQPLSGALPADAVALTHGLDAWAAARRAETEAAHPSGASPAALKKLLQDNGYWGVMTGTEAGR